MSDKATCIFCKIVAGQLKAQVVFENQRVVAFNDINPQAPIHIVIIPKVHVERVSSMSDSDMEVIADIHRAAKSLSESDDRLKDGFRLVTNNGANGGQTVDHLHFHLLGGRRLTWPPG